MLLTLAACERPVEAVDPNARKTAIFHIKYDPLVEAVLPDAKPAKGLVNALGGMAIYADGKRVGFYNWEEDSEIVVPADAHTLTITNEGKIDTFNPGEHFSNPVKDGTDVDVSSFHANDRFRVDCQFSTLHSFNLKKYHGKWAIDCVTGLVKS